MPKLKIRLPFPSMGVAHNRELSTDKLVYYQFNHISFPIIASIGGTVTNQSNSSIRIVTNTENVALSTEYSGLALVNPNLRNGNSVQVGDQVGISSTGSGDNRNQMQFSIEVNGQIVNPYNLWGKPQYFPFAEEPVGGFWGDADLAKYAQLFGGNHATWGKAAFDDWYIALNGIPLMKIDWDHAEKWAAGKLSPKRTIIVRLYRTRVDPFGLDLWSNAGK